MDGPMFESTGRGSEALNVVSIFFSFFRMPHFSQIDNFTFFL